LKRTTNVHFPVVFILLQPLTFIASFNKVCNVTNILFAFHGLYSKNACKTIVEEIRSSLEQSTNIVLSCLY
jgi:hypothetical protein